MGAFGLGLVQGLATETTAQLKTHIKDNNLQFKQQNKVYIQQYMEIPQPMYLLIQA